jgi:lysophospholipase L1-like esterase
MSYTYQPTKAPQENDRLILADQVANGATAASYQWPSTPEEVAARVNANNNQLAQAGTTGINPAVQAALSLKLDASEKGATGGVALADLSNAGAQAALASPTAVQTAAFGSLSRFRSALAARRVGGTSPVRILFPGDSTSAGYGAVGSATYAGCAAKSFPAYFAQILTASGIPAQYASFCGAGCDETATGGTLPVYDPRVTLGSGWASTATQQGVLGRRYIRNNSTTGVLSFAPGVEFDRIEIVHTNSGQFTVDIGGAVLATVNASTPLARTVVNCTAGTNTVNIARVSGDIFILSVNCYLSTGTTLSIINGGNPGATSATVANAATYNSLDAIGVIAPHLSVISLGINDINAQRSAAQFKTDMAAIIDKCQLSGDVALVSFIPFNSTYYSTFAAAYLAAYRELAAEKGCLFVDQTARFGSYADASAHGYYFDNVHPVAAGYNDFSAAIVSALRRFF